VPHELILKQGKKKQDKEGRKDHSIEKNSEGGWVAEEEN
jgi:hypothetical protein